MRGLQRHINYKIPFSLNRALGRGTKVMVAVTAIPHKKEVGFDHMVVAVTLTFLTSPADIRECGSGCAHHL